MQVNVRFLENLRLEASFDDFSLITDQPIRYKGDGQAPSPFDYFLASQALCAAYFVKLYCRARKIPTEDIKLSQNNIIDPEDRYKQLFNIQVELPTSISTKDQAGILQSIERCTVKRVIQKNPDFKITTKKTLGKDNDSFLKSTSKKGTKTLIRGKDCSLEETISNMGHIINSIGIQIEIASWRNLVPNVWSVHIRDADAPMCFTNGKGATKEAALCSALGEYLERASNNFFYNDYFLGEKLANDDFVHYPSEKWFSFKDDGIIPKELMDPNMLSIYNADDDLRCSHLIDINSGNTTRGICTLPYTRQSDNKTIFIPVGLIGNLFVSNGMSAGNTIFEARVQCLSEIFERAVKNQIIMQEICLPDVPKEILAGHPNIMAGINKLEAEGFPIVVKDASLGGIFPVLCVTLLNPSNGGVFASFGAHPSFEVALERCLTELLQGRSFEGLNDIPAPSFNQHSVTEPNNIVDHFIDSTGVISWKFFGEDHDYNFCHWDFSGTTEEEFYYLMQILKKIDKEVYITDYEELGAKTCRILVPGYSEIYPPSDLIWDNNNKAIHLRSDILNIHKLDNASLLELINKIEDLEVEDYTMISELLGIDFDENTAWGQLTTAELKCLIFLSLKMFEEAKEFVQMFLVFNDYSKSRKMYYQALDNVLEIIIDKNLELKNYLPTMTKIFGEELINIALKTTTGEIRFYGLTETDMNFKGLTRHLKLIESYEKLQKKKRLSSIL